LAEEQNVAVAKNGELHMTFSRKPKEEELTALFGTTVAYAIEGVKAFFKIPQDVESLRLPKELTGKKADAVIRLTYVSGNRTLRVEDIQIITAGRLLKPLTDGPFTIFNDGVIKLNFSAPIDKNSIKGIEGASLSSDGRILSVNLKPGVALVSLPHLFRDTNGNQLAQDYEFAFVYLPDKYRYEIPVSIAFRDYPWMEVGNGGRISTGVPLLLTVKWPILRESVEDCLNRSLLNCTYEFKWWDDNRLELIILDGHPTTITFDDYTDRYGYRHIVQDWNGYELSMSKPQVLKQVYIPTKGSVSIDLPVPVDGGLVLNEDFTQVRLYRTSSSFYMTYWSPSLLRHDFIFDIQSKQITSKEYKHSYTYGAFRAEQALSELQGKRVDVLAAGLSPTGRIAAIVNAGLTIYSKTGQPEMTLPIKLWESWWDYPLNVFWSLDETKIYYPRMETDKTVIVGVDLKTGEEWIVADKFEVISAAVPGGNLLLRGAVLANRGYYLLTPEGEMLTIPVGEGELSIGGVIDQESMLVNVGNEVYVYHIGRNQLEFLSTGNAFAYDSRSQTVYIVDFKR